MKLGWVLGCVILACSSTPAPTQTDGPTSITTDKGVVQGSVTEGGVRVWLGIPFAAPPVGPLRFKPPQDIAPWTSPIVANASGAECAQLATDGKTVAASSSEDCLYLNVWAPKVDVKNAPVFVWIYGGGFSIGSGGDPLYSGENLVSHLADAVVVTINYRLGPFGWLAHPELAAENGTANTASAGLLDQQAALSWVHRNIAAFGGDPANVTLGGESAGAISTCAHLAAPASNGLFARAIIESGVCELPILFTSPDVANAQGVRLANALSCTTSGSIMSCLRAASVTDVLTALPLRPADFGPVGESWSPTIDGVTLPTSPLDAVNVGRFAKVPLIMGTNLNEGDLFDYLYQSATGAPMSSSDLRTLLGSVFGSTVIDQIAAQYPVDTNSETAFSRIITDGFFTCATRRFVRAYSAAGGSAYLYHFTYPYEVVAIPNVTASHSYEVPFVFRNGYLGTQLSDADTTLADHMGAYWFTGLAAKGDPSSGGQPVQWPAYSLTNDTDLILDSTIATETGLKSATCDFWDKITP